MIDDMERQEGGGIGSLITSLPTILWERRWWIVVPLVIGLVGAIVAVLLMLWGGVHVTRPATGTLTVKVAVGLDPNTVLNAPFTKHLKETRMLTVETAKQGAALELKYTVSLKPDVSPIALIAELNRIEGVQGVEWKDGTNGK